jgi:PilZ domain
MEERRTFPRSRAYIGAKIAYNNRCCTMDCLVRNMSQDGARLIFACTATIPTKFDIVIRREGRHRPARVIWREETAVGVQYLDQRRAAVVSDEAAQQYGQF